MTIDQISTITTDDMTTTANTATATDDATTDTATDLDEFDRLALELGGVVERDLYGK